jgi:Txe/YoeB family toxin of Txe-Axe toxin-antitoxin module
VNSHAVADFWTLFGALPAGVRRQAYRAFRQFQRDPFHPSLHFKEVNKRKGIWSARVNDDYRVLGYREGGEIRWFWIGSHAEYNRLVGRQ